MLGSIVHLLAHFLIPMFLLGMAGSAIVVVITLASDLTDFLSDSGNETSTKDSLT